MLNAEQLKEWREAGREFLSAEGAPSVAPASLNAEQRTVDVVWFTGVDVARVDWWTGDRYMLRFDPKGADLSLLNDGASVLDNHSSWNGAAGQKGKVEKAWAEDGKYLGTLRFSRRPDVDGLWMDIQDGIVTKFSMGVEILESVEKRDSAGKLQMKTATKWRPFELSVAPIPADFGTTTLSNDVVRATAQTKKEAPMGELSENAGGGARNNEVEAARAEGAKLERERLAAIRKTAEPFVTRGEIDNAFLSQFETEGKTVDELKGAILEKLAQRSAQNPIQHQHGEIVRDEVGTRRELMASALLNRLDPAKHVVDDQNDFRRMSCVRMAEESLSRAGVRVRGLAPVEIAILAMQATADFPGVLENVARKRLLVSYSAATPTYRLWTAPSTTPDFKTMSRTRLGEAPTFIKVPEGGQITIAQMSESKETYAIATYGRGISFTRRMLIDDDLGAFNGLVAAFGMQAARLENKTVYAILTANAAMADTTALFHADHGNLGTGVIANTGLDSMFTAMGIQKGIDGATVLNLTPRFLIVPKAKEATARAALTAVGPTVKAADQNWFAGRLEAVADGELDADSTIKWYGAADPSIAPGVEYAHLEGASGPQILRKENEGGVLGVQLYAFLDFGAKAVDWRPLYASSGV